MADELYAWQERCLRNWFANQGHGIVEAATGSGKTLLALTAASRLGTRLTQELRVKIVVPTSALMHQWHRTLRDFLEHSENTGKTDSHPKIGLRGGGFNMSQGCQYMIYVINSARYELARQIISDLRDGDAVLLIADECHRYESEQNRLIFEFLPYIEAYKNSFFSLGLSATLPSARTESFLRDALGPTIYSYSMANAAAQGTVSPYDIFHISLSFLPAERQDYQVLTERMHYLYTQLSRRVPSLAHMDQKQCYELLRTLTAHKDRKLAEMASLYLNLSYKRTNLVSLASARISCAISLIEKLPDNEKILVFGERIRQTDELYRCLQEKYPGKVGRYHSRMGAQANQNTLTRFRDGDIRILIACKALDEGINIPDASIGIILSGTSVQRQRIQRLGRIIRKSEGKERASLYYLHMTESMEDACFLPKEHPCRIIELDYISGTRKFYNFEYQRAAEGLLLELRKKNTDSAKISETKRCLDLGSVRADWLSGSEQIEEKIRKATSVSERNYWICMKKMVKYRVGKSEKQRRL